MIRVGGTDSATGQRYILLILQPENIERMQNGEPVAVSLQMLAPDAITQPVELIIEAPKSLEAFMERQKQIAANATLQGVRPKHIPAPPQRKM